MSQIAPGTAAAPAGVAGLQHLGGPDAAAAAMQRRVLTALCYDVVGSTDLLAHLDIEDFQELMSAFQGAARQAITAREGVVRVEVGDGGVALFPISVDPKDAASLAIRAGLDVVDACARVGAEMGRPDLHVRVGIATSVALVQESGRDAVSDTVTGASLALATRLQALAQPDTVLVSQQTRDLARRSHAFIFMGAHAVKGFAEPERVWRALSHKREVDRFFAFGKLSIPLIGREREVESIAACWQAVVAGRGRTLLIEGEAGIGKSRLLYEVRRMTRRLRHKSLLFQCVPGGSRLTLQPLVQNIAGAAGGGSRRFTADGVSMLFRANGIPNGGIAETFSYLLGADGGRQSLDQVDPETIRRRAVSAVRDAVAAMCRHGPLVLMVEDAHWIDPTSRLMLEALARDVGALPLLLVVTSRPGAADWLPPEGLTRIALRPLDGEQTRRAIGAMLPADSRESTLVGIAARVSGGVPLFIEEISQWMSENADLAAGALSRPRSSGEASIFERILEARLDALGPARAVARLASVVGARVSQPLLQALLPQFGERELAAALNDLVEVGFLVRLRAAGTPVYSFRHALIQEAIYNAQLRRSRRVAHRQIFQQLEAARHLAPWMGDAALAEHAERAGLHEDAVALFIAAGKDNSARSALVEARTLLEHALDLSASADPATRDRLRLSVLVALGPVLTALEGPSSEPARAVYEEGVEIARRRPVAERSRWFPIFWGWWFIGTDVDGERAQAVLNDLRDVEDDEVQLQVRHCVWAIDFNLGRHESCIEAAREGLALYEPGRGRENITLYGGHDAKVCALLHQGLSHWLAGRPANALRCMGEGRAWADTIGHVGSRAHALDEQAVLAIYRRDLAALRAVIADMKLLARDHVLPSFSAKILIFEGWCEGVGGGVASGLARIREGLETLDRLQTPEDNPVYSGMLAELLTTDGKHVEALEILSAAMDAGRRSGHRYWLGELARRRAEVLIAGRAPDAEIAEALRESLDIAAEQRAAPILLAAFDMALAHGSSAGLAERYRSAADAARSAVEPGPPPVATEVAGRGLPRE